MISIILNHSIPEAAIDSVEESISGEIVTAGDADEISGESIGISSGLRKERSGNIHEAAMLAAPCHHGMFRPASRKVSPDISLRLAKNQLIHIITMPN